MGMELEQQVSSQSQNDRLSHTCLGTSTVATTRKSKEYDQGRRVFIDILSMDRLNKLNLDNAQLVGNIGSLLVGGQAHVGLLQAIRSTQQHI